MITKRPSDERGHFDYGWLDTRHTFSFGSYRDPQYRGFRSLRVINEDRVQPGHGFPAHDHQDMEIISYVLSGALEHRDSLGNGTVIQPGDVQRMSAGTGVTHSEFNPSPTEPVHLLQIWLYPSQNSLQPSYEQRHFPAEEKQGRLRLVASPDGRDGSLTIHQDAELYAAILSAGDQLEASLPTERYGWLQVIRGNLTVNGVRLQAGDGASIADEQSLHIPSDQPSELLLFNLA